MNLMIKRGFPKKIIFDWTSTISN